MPKQISEAAEYMTERIAAMGPRLWTIEEFEEGLQDLVDSCGPDRIGAVVQVLGDAMDAAVVGWVIDFGEGGALAFGSGGQPGIMKLRQAERALDYFAPPPLVTSRLVWTGK